MQPSFCLKNQRVSTNLTATPNLIFTTQVIWCFHFTTNDNKILVGLSQLYGFLVFMFTCFDIISGKVYKGKLSNNQHVAIKHITNEGNVETFVREVASSSHVRHPNLVALLGYCLRVDECFLIYELCPNGNLAEWLFGSPFHLLKVPFSCLIYFQSDESEP